MTWLIGLLGIGGLGAALFLIPGLLPRAIEAAGALLGVARRNPWPVAVLALLLACGLLWRSGERARDERDGARAALVDQQHAYHEAQVEAARLALAAKAATEARYKAHAQEIDREHETQLADARSDVDRFIANQRVRGKAVAGSGSKAVASADNRDPGVLAGMPADHVAVAESDLRACAAATAYAVAAREWALGLAR